MTAYTYIPLSDDKTDPGAPMTAEVGKAFAYNPIARNQGDDDVPNDERARLEMFPRLVAGDTTAWYDGTVQTATGTSYLTLFEYGFVQTGTIRIKLQYRSTGNDADLRVRRRRAGVTTQLDILSAFDNTSFFNYSFDLSVIVGDTLLIEGRSTTSGGSMEAKNFQVAVTDTQLIPPHSVSNWRNIDLV